MKRIKLSRTLAFVMTLALAAGILGVSGTALATVDSVGISPSIATVTVGGDTYIPLRAASANTGCSPWKTAPPAR